MTDCNLFSTPSYTTSLGLDTDIEYFNKSWKYSTLLSMLMYLASSSRADINFSVHQCVLIGSKLEDISKCAINDIRYRWFTNYELRLNCSNCAVSYGILVPYPAVYQALFPRHRPLSIYPWDLTILFAFKHSPQSNIFTNCQWYGLSKWDTGKKTSIRKPP